MKQSHSLLFWRKKSVVAGWLTHSVAILAITTFLCVPLKAQVVGVGDVVWEGLVGTTANYDNPGYGSSLQKTAQGNKADADGTSEKRIEGNGFVEFRFGQTTKTCAVGLGYKNDARTSKSIPFALQGDQSQQLHVLDNNKDTVVGSYSSDDVFRIERTGATIRYWKNGSTLLATSTAPSAGALLVDTSFSHSGASILNCRYGGSAGINDVIWKDLVSTSASYTDPGLGSALEAFNTTNFNADGVASGEIFSDGFVQFRFGQTDKGLAVGLSSANTDRSNLSLDYAFEGGADRKLYIRESGTLRMDPRNPDPSTNSSFGHYSSSDVLRIERAGSAVNYYRNDIPLYTSPQPSSDVLIVDTSFDSKKSRIENVQYSGASTAQPVLWENFVGTAVVSASGDSQLIKTAATNAWDSDATSRKIIPGNGYVEWKFGVPGRRMAVGLSHANTDNTLNGLEYAICANGLGSIQVYERGVAKSVELEWNPGDILRIQRIGSTILYLQNNHKIGLTNISSDSASESLLVDTAFLTPGGTVAASRLGGVKDDVIWRDLTNTSATYLTQGSGSTLTKSSSGTSWNASGVGETQLAVNGFVEFTMSSPNKSASLGFSTIDSGSTPTDMAVGFLGEQSGPGGLMYLTEYGASKFTVGPYKPSDVFKIERSGDQFYFYKNDVLLPYLSPVRSDDPLWINASFYDKQASVNAVQYYASSEAEDIIWNDEESAEGTYPTPNYGSRLQTLNKQPSTSSGANSSKVIAGDGFVQWRLEQADANVAVGLSLNRDGFSVTDLVHGICYRANDGALEVYQSGKIVDVYANPEGQPIKPSDTLKIVRKSGSIRYLLNEVEFYSNQTSFMGPVIVKGSFDGTSGAIIRAQYYQYDGDRDGMDDAWEQHYFHGLQRNGEEDFDSDGQIDLVEYQTQIDPGDYYNGLVPEVSAVQGNDQVGPQNSILPKTLKIRVHHGGAGLSNAPVTFGPVEGGGQIADLSMQSTAERIFVRTDSEGNAQVWFKTPENAPATSKISVTVGAASAVFFTEHTILTAPADVIAVPGDRRVTISWSGVPAASGYKVLRRVAGEDFQDFDGNVTADVTLTDTGLTNGTKYFYVVQALNTGGISSYSTEVSVIPILDADGDSLPDDWEMTYFGDLDQIAEGDFDADFVTNGDEFANELNPSVKDTDRDGRDDGVAMDGFIKWEQWVNTPGGSLAALNTILSFPYNPDNARYIHSLEMPVYQGEDYGARMAGYIRPTVSGNYHFWISGDDQAAFGISPNADPGLLYHVVETPTITAPRAFDSIPAQKSQPVHLEAGELYYFELISKQGYGFDHAEIAWQLDVGPREIVPRECLTSLRRVPIANYRFDEDEDTIAYNNSSTLVHATIHGGAIRGPGWISRGLTLDGNSGYVSSQPSNNFNITGEITLAAWISPIDASNPGAFMRIISKRAFGNAGGYELEYNPTIKRLTFCGQGGEQLIAYNIDLTKGYHHVAATLAQTETPAQFQPQLYVDGDLVEARIYINRGRDLKNPQVFSPLSSNNYPLTIGRHAVQIPNDPGTVPVPQFFKGGIDDVRIYNRAWPQAEIAEYIHSYTRGAVDRDHDGLDDQWEIDHFGTINYSELHDPDGDHLTNIYEYVLGTDPSDWDSNDDGISDGWGPRIISGSLDSDRNGLPDAWEMQEFGYIGNSPNADPDRDGRTNLMEYQQGSDPTIPENQDTDKDQMPDWWEKKYFTTLTRNGVGDYDGDGLIDRQEYSKQTDPLLKDTDGDSMPDGWEVSHFLNPLNASDRDFDPDKDNVLNAIEYHDQKDPFRVDHRIVLTLNVFGGVRDGGDINDDGWLLRKNGSFYIRNQTNVLQSEPFAFRYGAPFKLNPGETVDFRLEPEKPVGPAEYEVDFSFKYLDGATVSASELFANELNDPLKGSIDEGENRHFHWWFTYNPEVDTDRDGLPDGEEVTAGTDRFVIDTDNDGLSDWFEVVKLISNPLVADTDGDRMSDFWEYVYGFNLSDTVDAEQDRDSDGLSNLREFQLSTHPLIADSDGDSLSDNEEVNVIHTNPLAADSDGDGIPDPWELDIWKTNPLSEDTDGDGLPDLKEINVWLTNPLSIDTDGDALGDYQEVIVWHTNPRVVDTDEDQLTDGDEVNVRHSNPLLAEDTDGDTLFDGIEIVILHSNPFSQDSDGDGMDDLWEFQYGFDLNNPADASDDPDGEGLLNLGEYGMGTSPFNPDTDGDILDDLYEANEGLNPVSSSDAKEFSTRRNGLINVEQIRDPGSNSDGDRLSDLAESHLGTNRVSSDSDQDSVDDGEEAGTGISPTHPDANGDRDGEGLGNGAEIALGTRINDFDSDDDGLSDEWERLHGTNPHTLLSGILGWWRFDAGSNRYVYDAGQGMNDGLLRGSVASENNAVHFSGIGFEAQPAFQPEPRYFRVRATQGLVASDGLSVTFDAKVAASSQASGNADLVQKLGVYYVNLGPDRKLTFGVRVGGNWRTLVSSSSLTTNSWTHVAVVFNPATGESRISLNGVLSGAANGPAGNLNDAPAILQVGAVRANPSRSTAFSIDDLRLYGRPLTQEEVALLADPSSPAWEANQDWDADGLNNLEEYLYGSNPVAMDSDGDGLSDLDEISIHNTSPRLNDTDGDDLEDGVEIDFGTDPNAPDTDGDNLWDGEEIDVYGTNPDDPDTDGDGLPDGWEIEHDFDPNDDSDANANADGDLHSNLKEYENGSNPHFDERIDLELDTDGDGLSNYLETIYYGTDPNNSHTYDPNLNDFEWVMNGAPPTSGFAIARLNSISESVDRVVRALGPQPIATKRERDAKGGPCVANEIGFGTNTVRVKYELGAAAWLASWENGSQVLVYDQVTLSGTSAEGKEITETYSAPGTALPGVHVRTHIGQLPETAFAPAGPISVGAFLSQLQRSEDGLVTVTVRRTYREIVKNCRVDETGSDGEGDDYVGDVVGIVLGGWWSWGTRPFPVYNRPGSRPSGEYNPSKPGENDPDVFYSSSLAIYTCARPTLKVYGTGTRSAPGTEIKRPTDLEIPYFAVLNPNVDTDESREDADSSDNQIGTNDDDVMKVEIELPKEIRREGTVTIVLPSGIQAHDSNGQLLKPEDLIVDLADSTAKLHTLGTGQATLYIEAANSFAGGSLTVSTTGCTDHVRLVPAEIVPNFDRNETIDLTGRKDRGKVTEQNPWRWWINDDEDDGDIASGDSDVPGVFSGNAEPFGRRKNSSDPVVNGRCDLVDFFPLFFDVKALLQAFPPSSSTQYKLKHEDNGFGFVYSDLTPEQADDFCVGDATAGYGSNFTQPAKDATITKVSSSGVVLDPSFLQKITDSGKGTLLFEASKETDKPLVLEVTKGSEKLAELKFFVKVRGVEKMYRWINLRDVPGVGGSAWRATNLSPPDNYPDALTNEKNFFFIHGYSVREQQARGWNAEIFKRLHQLGSKAKFVAVVWRGDQGKLSDWIYQFGGSTPDYYENVINAFETATHLASIVNSLPGQRYFAAHSLGNMVATSAIKDHSMNVTKYLLINAAVALEAYDASVAADTFMRDRMRHPAWHDYSTRLWSSEWYHLFDSSDGRKTLTWRGRFGVIDNAINFYSTGEDVLRNNPDGKVPPVDFEQGDLAWSKQEIEKGGALIDIVTLDSHGGWGFNPDWDLEKYDRGTGTPAKFRRTPIEADELTEGQLRTSSFFKRFSEASVYDQHQGSAVAQDDVIRTKLLAEALPALSFATGANGLRAFENRNIDMMNIKTGTWPRSNGQWRHSDFRVVAFYFTQQFYHNLISEGALRQ